MYGSVHGAIGQVTVAISFALAATYLPEDMAYITALLFGSIIGFLSHDLTDALNEKSYGAFQKALFWEIPAFIFTMTSLLWYDYWAILVVGWFAGNGMDVIDKKFYVYFILGAIKTKFYKGEKTLKIDKWMDKFKPMKIFPCHRQNTLYNFTLKQTQIAAVMSLILAVSISLLIN